MQKETYTITANGEKITETSNAKSALVSWQVEVEKLLSAGNGTVRMDAPQDKFIRITCESNL